MVVQACAHLRAMAPYHSRFFSHPQTTPLLHIRQANSRYAKILTPTSARHRFRWTAIDVHERRRRSTACSPAASSPTSHQPDRTGLGETICGHGQTVSDAGGPYPQVSRSIFSYSPSRNVLSPMLAPLRFTPGWGSFRPRDSFARLYHRTRHSLPQRSPTPLPPNTLSRIVPLGHASTQELVPRVWQRLGATIFFKSYQKP
jgi:hypothetical protein